MSSFINDKKEDLEAASGHAEKQDASKPILSRVHVSVLKILTKMLAVHSEILRQLMADGYEHKVLDATADMDCKEALHLLFGKVELPEGHRKLLRLMYQPTDSELKLFQGIEHPISQLFYSGDAYLTDNEGDVHDIPEYLKMIDEDGYRAIQLECAYSLNDDGDDFENISPDRARLIAIPKYSLQKACFELGTAADHRSGEKLNKLPLRLSSHIVGKLDSTHENEQKLLQSLITQSSTFAKGVLN